MLRAMTNSLSGSDQDLDRKTMEQFVSLPTHAVLAKSSALAEG